MASINMVNSSFTQSLIVLFLGTTIISIFYLPYILYEKAKHLRED